jgi:low temperature requirement protein LtrA
MQMQIIIIHCNWKIHKQEQCDGLGSEGKRWKESRSEIRFWMINCVFVVWCVKAILKQVLERSGIEFKQCFCGCFKFIEWIFHSTSFRGHVKMSTRNSNFRGSFNFCECLLSASSVKRKRTAVVFKPAIVCRQIKMRGVNCIEVVSQKRP